MWKFAMIIVISIGAALPVSAGALYRCVGDDGVPNYSSKRVSNSKCKVVATTPRKKATPSVKSVSVPATVSVPEPELASVNSASTASSITASSAAASSTAASTAGPAHQEKKHVVFQTSSVGDVLTPVRAGSDAKVTRGAVYKFQKDGITHYTNVRPNKANQAQVLFSYVETCFACSVLPGVNFGSLALNTQAYSEEIRSAAQNYGVEEAVVRAVIHAESAFRPNARSHKGAQGLMQLIPATASRFGVSDAFDPAQNIRGGVQYLAWLMKRYGSNLTLVAAAYNAGEGAVDRNGGVPPYTETQRYVQRVAQLAERYRTALALR